MQNLGFDLFELLGVHCAGAYAMYDDPIRMGAYRRPASQPRNPVFRELTECLHFTVGCCPDAEVAALKLVG